MFHEHYTAQRSLSVLTVQDHFRDTFGFLVTEEVETLSEALTQEGSEAYDFAPLALFARLAAAATDGVTVHEIADQEVDCFRAFLRSVLTTSTQELREAADAENVLTRVRAAEHIELADDLAAQLGGYF
jgi:hypothetical protein